MSRQEKRDSLLLRGDSFDRIPAPHKGVRDREAGRKGLIKRGSEPDGGIIVDCPIHSDHTTNMGEERLCMRPRVAGVEHDELRRRPPPPGKSAGEGPYIDVLRTPTLVREDKSVVGRIYPRGEQVDNIRLHRRQVLLELLDTD